jgi:hypothetical protein
MTKATSLTELYKFLQLSRWAVNPPLGHFANLGGDEQPIFPFVSAKTAWERCCSAAAGFRITYFGNANPG